MALFLFAGAMKFIMSAAEMDQGPIHLPLVFIRFIGCCEILGALGLVFPGMFKIRPALTPLAAIGLTVIMLGAIAITLWGEMGMVALIPAVTGALAASVAYGRRGLLV